MDEGRPGHRERKGELLGGRAHFLICYSPVLARASPVWGLRIQTVMELGTDPEGGTGLEEETGETK